MSTILTLIMILVIILGFLASVIMFIVGIIRGLLKKGWRLVLYSILLFVGIIIFFSVARIFYGAVLGPANYKNLQNLSQPRPLNSDGTINFNATPFPGNPIKSVTPAK